MILRELLAEYAHKAWSGWMNYLFSKCGKFNSDGSFTIFKDSVDRWLRQANTPYHALPEEEKDSDRIEADKMIRLMNGELE